MHAARLSWSRWLERSLRWRWRQHCLTSLAVAVAVAVLAGAMVVGWSLERSIRQRLLARLGQIAYVMSPSGGVTVGLADRLAGRIGTEVGLVFETTGVASTDEGLAVPGAVWGVLDVHRPAGWLIPTDLAKDEVIVNDALARDLHVSAGEWIVVRADLSTIRPAAGLFSYRDASDLTRTTRLRVRQVAPPDSWADFSRQPTQREARNLFLCADVLGSTELRMNRVLFTASPGASVVGEALAEGATLDDLGLIWRKGYIQDRNVVFSREHLESITGALHWKLISTHIAEEISSGAGRASYGVIAAESGPGQSVKLEDDQVILNQWVADDLHAKAGERVTLVALIAQRDGGYVRKELPLTVARISPMGTGLFDSAVTPELEGMTTAARIDRWKTPFPVDMRKVSERDEKYWERFRAAPKAIISWNLMQQLWHESGFVGPAAITAIAVSPDFNRARVEWLVAHLGEPDPTWGLADLRVQMNVAGRGSADFASLFAMMSAFLIVAGVAIAAGVITTGIEARITEIGLATAVGVAGSTWRMLLLVEQLIVCLPGIALGLLGGIAYALGLMWLFTRLGRGVWEMPRITADVRILPLVGAGIMLAATILLVARLQMGRQLGRSARDLLSGAPEETVPGRPGGRRPVTAVSIASALAAAAAVGAARFLAIPPIAAFAVAAVCMLVAGWLALRVLVSSSAAPGRRRMTMTSLSVQFMRSQQRRALLAFGVFGAASFVVCAVAIFRSGVGPVDTHDIHGATGGLSLRLSSPVGYRSDLGTTRGRERMSLPAILPEGARILSLLSSGGTEGGCLNLAVPGEMQVLGIVDAWADRDAFEIITADHPRNPWDLLGAPAEDGSIPVFGDEETMQWIAHRQLGDEFEMPFGGRMVTLRLVGLIRGGLFSGQLLMDGDALRGVMRSEPGYSVHFVEVPRGAESEARKMLAPLRDYGFAIEDTARIVASVRSVQELYMTLFVVLGALGLLLGVGGSVVVLVRDALLRQGELALLQAVGLGRAQTAAALLVSHLAPLAAGVVVGMAAAATGYLALGRPVHLLTPILLCTAIIVVGGMSLAVIARAMQPRALSSAMRTQAAA